MKAALDQTGLSDDVKAQLEARLFDKCGGSEDLGIAPPSLRCTLRKIIFRNSKLGNRTLERLLVACPLLTTLSIQWSPVLGDCCMEMNETGQLIRSHGANFQVLTLKPDFRNCYHNRPPIRTSPLGSLASPSALRVVTAPYTVLFGKNKAHPENYPSLCGILPKSLRTLKIVDNSEDDPDILDEQLWAFMQDESFSALKTIRGNPGAPFSDYAEDIGCDESETNQYWVVLKRMSTE